MWNDVVELIEFKNEIDEYGNDIGAQPKITKVYCQKQSISRQEYYQAAQVDMNPSITVIIHPYEYSNQKYVRFDGLTYKINRTYQTDFEELELVCEEYEVLGLED